MQIVHLSTVHPRFDSRIFLKQCRSLAKAGHDVHFVVADGKGDELYDGVQIQDIGVSNGRLERILKATRRMCRHALKMNADIYHLHDPELLLIASALKRAGHKVVFDAHEDLPKQILGKPYIKRPVRKVLSYLAKCYEGWVCRKLDGVVAATPYIRDKFLQINPSTVDVNNYPILKELAPSDGNGECVYNKNICYVGGLSRDRGIKELLEAVSLCEYDVTLKLAGNFTDTTFKNEIEPLLKAPFINELQWLNRNEVKELLETSFVGMVTLRPLVNYLDSLPIKMFEYMSAGLPIIASDFPLWKSIVKENNCGLCVDPLSPEEIAKAIDYMVANPAKVSEMGRNGLRAVKEKYNWENEYLKLETLYSNIKVENK